MRKIIKTSLIAGLLMVGVAIADSNTPALYNQIRVTVINNTQSPLPLTGIANYTPVNSSNIQMYWLVNPNGPVIPAQGQGSTTISINVDEMSVSSMKESTGFMYIHMGQADSANYQNTGSGCSVQIPYAAYMFPAPYQYINDALNLTPGNFGEPQDYEAPMAVANNNSAYVCSGALVPNRNHPGSYNVVVTVNPVSTN